MDLQRIAITRFRNLGKVDEITLPRGGLLVAAAPNAIGKTNFLESVAVLLRGRSFRARIEDCVAWGQDSFLLTGDIVRAQDEVHRVAVRYHRPAKKLRIEEDGVPASLVSFYAHYPLVLFLPEDTFLFSRGPAARRNFLNQVLVAHPPYVSALVQYHRVLKQRNALLKRPSRSEEIEGWTHLLAEHAEALWRYRESFAVFLSDQLSSMYERLSGERKSLSAQLVFGAKRRENFVEEMAASLALDRRLGFTTVGPHRDDLFIETGGHTIRTALSRGQLRTLVIALKVLTHTYTKQVTEEEPLLLLDDVLSELDEERQAALLSHLPTTQILLTCTTVPQSLRQRSDVFLLDVRTIVDQARRTRPEQPAVPADELPAAEPVPEAVPAAAA